MTNIEKMLEITYKECILFLKEKHGKVNYNYQDNKGKKMICVDIILMKIKLIV